MPEFRTEPTPNPDSVKITSDHGPFIDGGMESFSSIEEAADHPLGSTLLRIPGIANVFIMPQFVTVTKQPAASWDEVMPKVKQALSSHF